MGASLPIMHSAESASDKRYVQLWVIPDPSRAARMKSLLKCDEATEWGMATRRINISTISRSAALLCQNQAQSYSLFWAWESSLLGSRANEQVAKRRWLPLANALKHASDCLSTVRLLSFARTKVRAVWVAKNQSAHRRFWIHHETVSQ